MTQVCVSWVGAYVFVKYQEQDSKPHKGFLGEISKSKPLRESENIVSIEFTEEGSPNYSCAHWNGNR